MLLPRKVGPFTLMRKLDADGISESFVAILDDPPGKQVVARRILPVVTRDPVRTSQLKARVGDLRAAQHPTLVPLMSVSEADGDLYVIEEWSDGVDLDAIVNYCVAHKTTVPHNVFLNLATQVCNALEALHARPGAESGSENVLHLALTPKAMWVTVDGRVTVGRYGLSRSPTAIATSATGTLPVGVEYLAPEQTHQDQKLTPASDIFALGSILYELLTLKAMFRAESSLQTIHRVRRAEVTTQLLEVKEIMPGLDKVLFRALSLNPRHRYQRAFVLREDLRGLMAGYSFSDIETVTRAFLSPIIRAKAEQGYEESPAGAPEQGGDTTGFLLPSRPSARPDPRSSDRLSVTELPRAGEGAAEHTDALLADLSEPISQLFPEPGRPAYDADTADTSRRQGYEALPKADEEDTNIREGGTGWIKREPKQPEPEPVRRPLTPIQTSFSSRPASSESTQSLLEDTGIHDTLPAPGESTQPTPAQSGSPAAAGLAVGLASAGAAARRPSETRTIEVIGEGLDAPQKPKMQSPARPAEPLAQPRKPEPKTHEPKTHGATLLPEAELQPPREHTRTLELDAESKSAVTGKPSSADQWNEVPTASKHFSDLSSLPEPASKPSPKPPETVRLPAEAQRAPEAPAKPAPPPSAASSASVKPAAERLRSTPPQAEQKPQSSARPSGQRSVPPPAKPPERPLPKHQDIDSEDQPSRPPWLPIAAGAVVLGLSLAVCTGLGAGVFFGLTGGAVAVNNNLQSEEERIAMAQPPIEPQPEAQPQIAAIEPVPAPSLPVEPEPVVAPEPAAEPEPVVAPEPAPEVRPQPEPVALSTIQPKPALPLPAPPSPAPPKPPAPTKPPVSKISSQQQPAEIHKALATPVPAPAPSGTSSAPAVALSEIDRWADAAFKGELSPGATQQLAAIAQSDPGYTRARTLLYLDAKARGDNATRDAHLGAMMMLPENKYNPVLLVEKAMIAVERQDWQTALKSSQTAEQHWARIPSELIFSRKAMIYEIEAVSNTGLFYGSAGEDQDRLLQAIRGWERYQNHVRSMNRADLVKRAEENLNKLYEIQRRLE